MARAACKSRLAERHRRDSVQILEAAREVRLTCKAAVGSNVRQALVAQIGFLKQFVRSGDASVPDFVGHGDVLRGEDVVEVALRDVDLRGDGGRRDLRIQEMRIDVP